MPPEIHPPLVPFLQTTVGRDEGNKTERQGWDGSAKVIKPHTKTHDLPQGHRGEAPVGVATCVQVVKEARCVLKQEASSLPFIWLIVF